MIDGLIINVDDFGLTQGINEAVRALATLGTISATNVMPNMPFAEQIQDIATEFPDLSLGVHINLTQGRPLNPPGKVRTLVDADGNFLAQEVLFKRALRGKISNKDCELEIEAQVKAIKDMLGNRIDHWNSHQGVHRIPPFLNAALNVCKRYGISAMRSHRHGFIVRSRSLDVIRPGPQHFAMFGFRRIFVETYYRFAAHKAARYFLLPNGSLVLSGSNTNGIFNLLLSERPIVDGVWEIPCHPAQTVQGLWGTSLLQQRLDEYRVLASNEFVEAILSRHIRLITFPELTTA